jgi:hypothetical protein
MEGDIAAYRVDKETLRAARPEMPRAAETGGAALGIRQQEDIKGLKRGKKGPAGEKGGKAKRDEQEG